MTTPQYITDNKGNKLSVVLPMKEYKKIMEELKDIRLYDKAKKNDTGERIPMQEAFTMIEAKRQNKS